MGSICAGNYIISKPETRRSTLISNKNDIHFNTGMFVQENSSSFHSLYKLNTSPIGYGAFASVWKCTHKRTGDERAVKILLKAGIPQKDIDSRAVFNEVEILKTLDHPNIVKVFEYFEDDCNYYILMEYCAGGDLFDKLQQTRQFTEVQAVKIMKKLFSALNYLHSKGVIHRDLKPENILVVQSDQLEMNFNIKVTDFNVSKGQNNLSSPRVAGTVDYMAPEAFDGKFDEKCDLWSCGVILYLLVAGAQPFGAETDELIKTKIIKGQFSFPSELFDIISESCKDLISQLLTKDSTARISAADALLHPWFAVGKEESLSFSMLAETLNSIKEPNKEGKLREFFTTFMVSQLNRSIGTSKYDKYFSAIDKNGDGVISFEELKELLMKKMSNNEAEEQAKIIMSVADTEGTGFIDYSDFLRISAGEGHMLTTENLKKTFCYFDRNCTEKIEKEDLRMWLSADETIPDEVIDELIKEADKNEDGFIDFTEFEELLRSRFNFDNKIEEKSEDDSSFNLD